MKKIYLFLIAFCLFAGNVWAKTFTYNFDWRTDKAVCTVNQMSGSSLGNSYYATWLYQLIPNYVNTSSSAARPALSLELGFDNYYDGYYTLSYMETAPWDTYTCSTTTSFGSCPSHILCALGNCFYLDESGNKYTFKSGSIVVENGRHGYAYMYSKNLKDNSNNTFNVTVGQSLNLTTNYTELEIATDAKNKKAALFAFDGENRLNLIFDVATLNETIGIPAGTYTIGTNVFGEAYDIDGQTKWELKSGTIKISQSGSNLVLSTTSLKGLEPDDTGTYNLSLSCNLTPSISAASSVTDVNAVMNVDEYNEWFQVWGFDGDAKDLGMRISVYKGIVPGGNVSAASPTNYLLDIDNGGTMIATKNGKIAANENYIVSNLYYDKFYKTGTADIAMKGIDGNFYMGRIYTTFFMCDGAMYLEYDATQSFGSLETNYPWDEIEFGEADEEEGTYSIVGKGGEYQLSLSCIHPLDGIGYLPTGNYSINPSHTAGSLQVGGYDMNEGDVNGSLVFASNLLEGGDGTLSNDNFWTLRGGKVSITNVNEQYYVIVDALNDRCEDTETKYTIQYTIGEAPKTLVINVRGDGSAAGSFTWTAEGWEGHISNFPQDVPFQLFEGQQIDIHATPNAGSKFVRWEIDGVTVSEDEDFSYIVAATTSTIVAVFEEVNETYTLTWDFNGGETTSADGDYTNGANITEGEFIVAPADPTLEGYTFAGWLNSITGEKEMAEDGYMPTPMPAEDLTYTAQWTANTYTVHFDKNNDFYQAAGAITGEMEDQLFTYDAEDVALTANAYEWAGHTFQGWATAADGEKVYEDGEAVSNLTAEQNGEVVLYAVWDINEYTITFQDAEADGGHVWGSDDFAYGTVPAYNGEPMPSKEADEQYTYQFAGWKDAAGIKYPIGTDLPAVEGETTYYAVYTATKVPYELVWDVNGGDELTGDYTQGTVEWGTEIVAPAAPTREGYTFTGWMNGNTNEIELPAEETNIMPFAMPVDGLTYAAQWEANVYYVRFFDNGEYYNAAGTIEGTMPDQTFYYDEGQYLQANAFTWEGHTFQGWATTADGEVVYGDVEDITDNLTSVKDAVIELYAVWTTDTYTITFKNSMGDDDYVWWSGELAYGTIPVYEGETPVKAADADYTYTFAGWMVNLEEQYPIGTDLPKVTEDATYLAMYTQEKTQFAVRFVNPDGSELQRYELPIGAVPAYDGVPTQANEGDEYNYYVFTFTGWIDDANNSYGASATLPAVTGEITYMAQYSKQLFINLQEQMDDDYYTDFSDKYNGERATTATLVRKFDQGKWATLCLPFNVNAAVLTSSGLKSRIYEFKYTKGDAENGFTLYFAQANKLDAGKGYIVNANAVLAQKTQFVFPNVVVNTNADIQSGFDITTLEGYNSQGNIYLVGTLRQGKVLGDDGSGIYYMGLSSNKIKLANSTTGTVVRAYRGIFRSTERIQVSRVRIVAESEDGEIVDELEVVDGEMKEASAPYKYVQDGILYIVRDGVRYTAEGQRID